MDHLAVSSTLHPNLHPVGREMQNHLLGRTALVTGASSGVGQAMALALAHAGAELYLIGRDPARLRETTEVARRYSPVSDYQIDLTAENNLQPLLDRLEREGARLDILIHCAGAITAGLMQSARLEDLDFQYAVNVRAPYVLTQRLLPLLKAAHGQIVFINSSLGLAASRPDVGQYSAMKHALKAIADSLRTEVNPQGIRVLTVYLGRTATPMQEASCRQEGRAYEPDVLLQPEDVASTVLHALMLPATAEVTDISIRPMRKSY